MKFTGASGKFTAGKDDDEIEHGTEFAANIFDSKYSWNFWWEGKILETQEDYIRNDPYLSENEPNELPEDPEGVIDMSLKEIRAKQADRDSNFMDGWGCQAIINLRPLDGSDDEYTLKLNQGVAMNSFHKLRKAFSKKYKMNPGKIPLISLDVDRFKTDKVGWRFAPVLPIIGWASEEELMAMAGDDPADYDDAPAQEALPAPAEDVKEEKAKPATRGRRGARGANYD